MAWPQKLGVSLVTAGTLLLSVYVVPTVYGAVMSRVAVHQFRSQSLANSHWNSERILAYQRTLDVRFAPPEAVLRIPKVGIEVPVLEGVSDLALNRGVGHVPGTALPGQPGNVAIAGHRDGFFRGLKDVYPGDVIEVQRSSFDHGQQTDHYVIRSTRVVSPSDTSVLKPTAGSTLTLITCFPFYFVGSAPQRYIVQADRLPSTPSARLN